MGITIFSTLYAFYPGGVSELISGEGSTNVGLTFIFLPKLFTHLPGGPIVQASFASLFFLAFFSAALSSLISMIQLTTQTLNEFGISRNRAIIITGVLGLLLGAPSALSIKFLDNQDWVWGVGLIVSGLFIAFAVIRYGIDQFRQKAINSSTHDFYLGKFYNVFIGIIVPAQAIILITWWFYRSITFYDRDEWWNPFHVNSLGTIILQWGAFLLLFILFNKWLVKKLEEK